MGVPPEGVPPLGVPLLGGQLCRPSRPELHEDGDVLGALGDVEIELDGDDDGELDGDDDGELDGDEDGVFDGDVRSMPLPIICFSASGRFGWPAR